MTVSLIRTVRQLGHAERCARKHCTSKPMFRVILGSWVVQAYTCTRHLAWAVKLDDISQDTGTAMGWAHGYPEGASRRCGPTQVTPLLSLIKRLDFGRAEAPNISATYPRTRRGVPAYHD